jgi:hypothetical protein
MALMAKAVEKRIPPLDGSDWLSKKRSESIAAVKYGQRGEITVNGIKYKMPCHLWISLIKKLQM